METDPQSGEVVTVYVQVAAEVGGRNMEKTRRSVDGAMRFRETRKAPRQGQPQSPAQ